MIIKTLGLPDSLYDEMCETNALMGRQTESYEYYDVSWSYHPDNGLDVIFKYNNKIVGVSWLVDTLTIFFVCGKKSKCSGTQVDRNMVFNAVSADNGRNAE